MPTAAAAAPDPAPASAPGAAAEPLGLVLVLVVLAAASAWPSCSARACPRFTAGLRDAQPPRLGKALPASQPASVQQQPQPLRGGGRAPLLRGGGRAPLDPDPPSPSTHARTHLRVMHVRAPRAAIAVQYSACTAHAPGSVAVGTATGPPWFSPPSGGLHYYYYHGLSTQAIHVQYDKAVQQYSTPHLQEGDQQLHGLQLVVRRGGRLRLLAASDGATAAATTCRTRHGTTGTATRQQARAHMRAGRQGTQVWMSGDAGGAVPRGGAGVLRWVHAAPVLCPKPRPPTRASGKEGMLEGSEGFRV